MSKRLTPRDYAERGAKALDELCGEVGIIPCDWRERINCETLDLMSGNFCVLGQLATQAELPRLGWEGWEGPYSRMLRVLSKSSGWASAHGFDMVPNVKRWSGADLTDAWKTLLKCPPEEGQHG